MFVVAISSLGDSFLPIGSALFAAGALLGYGLLRWRDGRSQATIAKQKETALEEARREAEALVREARLVANEEVLKLRDQTEQSFAKRRQEVEEVEKRLAEREGLINRQLHGLMQEDQQLREQKQELQKQ